MESKIIESEQLIQWLDSKIDGLKIPSNDRSRLSAGCLDTALEHHKAIVLLSAKLLHGSAAALIRILFEAYVRGLWLFYSASDNEIEEFKKDKINKNFGQLITELEKLDAFKEGTLSFVKDTSWKAMNSFTHSGIHQVLRRNTSDSIMPCYTIDEQEDTLSTANSVGLLASIAIANMADNNELALAVFKQGQEYFANQS